MSDLTYRFHSYKHLRPISTYGLVHTFEAIDDLAGPMILRVLRSSTDDLATEAFSNEIAVTEQLIGFEGSLQYCEDGTNSSGEFYYLAEGGVSETLHSFMAHHGTVDPYQASGMIYELALALQSVGEQSHHHRNISPYNCFIAKSGELLLGGFGWLDASEALIEPNPYCAPEILQGFTTGPSASAADIYGLGAMLRGMITGSAPYDISSLNSNEAATLILNNKPEISEVAVPEEIATVIEVAMAKDPERRFSTMADFASELAEARRKSANRVIVTEPNVAPPQGLFTSAPATNVDELSSPDPRQDTVTEDSGNSSNDGVSVTSITSSIVVDGDLVGAPDDRFASKFARSFRSSDNSPDGQLNGSWSSGEDAGPPTDQVEIVTTPLVPNGQEKKFPFLPVIVAVLITAIVCAGVFALFSNSFLGRALVGQYEGLTLIEAETALSNLGVGVVLEEQYKDGTKAGDVIGQRPEAGTRIDPDGTITLTISAGPVLRAVPDLVNLSVSDAKAAIKEAKLTAGKVVEQRDHPNLAKGRVVTASVDGVDAQEEYPTGTKLDLVESTGLVQIPKGLSGSTFEADLTKELELEVEIRQEVSQTVPKGEVIRTEPAMGKSVDQHSKVVVYVALDVNPGNVQVPGLNGKKLRDGIKLLQDKGFSVNVVARSPNCDLALGGQRKTECDNYKKGLIFDHSPKRQAPPGSTITIFAKDSEVKKLKNN